MKPAAPAGSRAGLALALLCLAAPARADELCTSWYAAHERCHDAHATDDDASCCEGSDIQASCQCASATGWWNNRRLSAVDEPRRLGHCCDYGAYCSCMESELGAGCAAPDDECGEDGDEDEDWYEDWMWDGGCQPEYCTSTDGGDGYDCCASMDWGEPATCANGYTPTPSNPSEDDCLYTCCPTEDVDVDAFCRENGFEPDNFDAQRQAYPLEDEFLFGFQSGTCQFVAMKWDEQWATCCCSDPSYCCAWGEDENCKSRDEDWEDEDAEGMLDEELVERVDAMKREVDALMALVIVLLVVVGALILYLVPWRRRAAFASPSLSVELNPTTYNELGRGSVEGI